MKNNVCCVIISYNDVQALVGTINAIYNQVEKVLVIDNGSNEKNISLIKKIKKNNIEIIFNSSNLGIASALNIGVKFCVENNYKYILTLDQDSLACNGMVEELILAHGLKKNIAITCPSYSSDKSLNIFSNNKFSFKNVVITSGNLIKVEIFKKVGLFEEKLFIDSVDFDFCLRVRKNNFDIVQVNYLSLNHRLGSVKKIFNSNIEFIQHSYIRNYYIFRNTIYLLKKYFKDYKLFCFKKVIFTSKLFLENIMFNDDRWKVTKYSLIGLKDGLFNNYGKMEG